MELNRNTIAIVGVMIAILAMSTIAMMKDMNVNAIIQHHNGQNANGHNGQNANGSPGQNGGIGGAGEAGGVGTNGGNNCIGTC